jgi:hypothetical protein
MFAHQVNAHENIIAENVPESAFSGIVPILKENGRFIFIAEQQLAGLS